MNGPDPIDPYDEADEAIGRIYKENEKLRAENAHLMKTIEWAKEHAGEYFCYYNDFGDRYSAFEDGFRDALCAVLNHNRP